MTTSTANQSSQCLCLAAKTTASTQTRMATKNINSALVKYVSGLAKPSGETPEEMARLTAPCAWAYCPWKNEANQ